MSNNRIPLAGVIGSPIGHSRSPLLHRHWLAQLGLKGFYIPMEVAREDLERVIRTLPAMGFVGVNITVPHKELVMEIADMVTDRATLIGAVNTLIFRKDGKIHADNTDGYGFMQNLRTGAPDWDPKSGPALVLGAGGAARAVVASLSDSGVDEILITNRTKVRADKLKDDFGKRVQVVDWVQAGNAIESAALIINTTSLGMVGKPEMRVPLDGFRAGQVVMDLVYNPLQTHFLATAAGAGCTTIDGLGMLLHQAVPGFERWFGARPEVTQKTRDAVLR